MSKKILVTGGSGFLGSRLIPGLVREGHEVFALVRSASSDEKVRALGSKPVRGDLEQAEPLSLPVIDAVIHAAARFRFAGPREPYFRANVTGTRVLLEAAEVSGAKVFVYVSAAGVIMDDRGSPIRNADETARTFPTSFSGYLASKAQAEAAALAADKPGFRTIALRPSAMWGPGDPFSREIPGAIGSGHFAFINRGDYPFSTCHVDNVVEAVCLALDNGIGGRAYFINDRETTTFRDFIAKLAALQGLSIEKVRAIPYRPAFTLGRLMEIGAALVRSADDPPLTRSMIRMIGREMTTSDAAARRDLGYVGKVSRADGLAAYRV
jgi:nucleoside-diphosphate-sugar epimerase